MTGNTIFSGSSKILKLKSSLKIKIEKGIVPIIFYIILSHYASLSKPKENQPKPVHYFRLLVSCVLGLVLPIFWKKINLSKMSVFNSFLSKHFTILHILGKKKGIFYMIETIIFVTSLVIVCWSEAAFCVVDYFQGEIVLWGGLLAPVLFSFLPFASIFIQCQVTVKNLIHLELV